MKAGALLGLALGLTLAVAPRSPAETAAPAADPFYLSLLLDGTHAFDEGDAAGAARMLRLACFGLLEDPAALAGCLVRLGLAEATAGDREAFFETWRRLATVEQRFDVYRRADLPDDVRSRFEEWLVRLVPEQQLASAETFSALAMRRIEVRVRRMAPRERRRELAARLAEEPGSPRWSLLLAELEVEEGKPREALARAEAVVAAQPADPEARCVRGLARAASGACPGAVEDLAPCRRCREEPWFAEALLSCQVTLAQWALARDLLASLPAEIREDRRIARLAQRVEREGTSPGALVPPAAEAQASPSPPAGKPEPPAPAPAPEERRSAAGRSTLSPADADKLERARQLAGGVRHAGQLEEPLRLAAEVALANPGSTEAQHLAALLAYRASRWQEAISYFRRGGDPGDDRPVLLFYFAVSCYEAGDREAAAAALARALPKLERTPFVESYRSKILGGETDGSSGASR